MPNPAFERDCAKARSPSTLRSPQMPVHVYLDNCLVSGEVRGDLAQPAEAVALARLRDLEGKGLIDLFTSRLSWVEQDRTRDPLVRATLQSARDKTQVVPVDARLLGFNTQDLGHRGFISAPILTSVLNPTLRKPPGPRFAGVRRKPPDTCASERLLMVPDYRSRLPRYCWPTSATLRRNSGYPSIGVCRGLNLLDSRCAAG